MKQSKKLKVKIYIAGQLPFQLDFSKLIRHKSRLFAIEHASEDYIDIVKNYKYLELSAANKIAQSITVETLKQESQTVLESSLNNYTFNDDSNTIIMVVTYIHLQDEWYSKVLKVHSGRKIIVLSYADIYDPLSTHLIPLENLLISTLLTYILMYYAHGGQLPDVEDERKYMHYDTRGCLMDFCIDNADVIFSAEKPCLCAECQKRYITDLPQYSAKAKIIEKEAKKIRKKLIYRIKDFLLYHPILSISISTFFAILLGVSGSIICDNMSENLKNYCMFIILFILGLLFTLIVVSCFILIRKHIKNKKR